MSEDYYKTLGISRGASQTEIQQAYRELARKYHPDLNPDDKTAKKKFQEVQAAFDVLNDSEKRELYDRYGNSFEQMSGAPGQGSAYGQAGPGGFEDVDFAQFFGERFAGGGGGGGGGFSDIFEQFRRRGGGPRAQQRRAGPARGADIESEVRVPFVMAVLGGDVQIRVERSSGKIGTLQVKIPRGIADGKKIRLRGQGAPSTSGGSAGDLLIMVRVDSHPCFSRRGDHLHVTLPVTVAEAAAGATVDVPSPYGTVALRMPAGTSSGAKLRVRGHGIETAQGKRGDLLAEVQVMLPPKMEDSVRELFKEIGQRAPFDPRTQLRW